LKKYIALDDMANKNCSAVLDIIRKKGTVSKKEITEISSLSWGGMTKIVNKLLEKNYITDVATDGDGKPGRIPVLLSINKNTNFIIGLDINLMGFGAVVMNLAGEILDNFSVPTPKNNHKDFIFGIETFLENIFGHFDENSIIAIGIAMQGIVDHKNGISVRYPGVNNWENVPIKAILEEKFGVCVYIEHDPDCLLYPHLESEKGNIILLRIDESIGMSVALYGKLIKGEGIFEISHNIAIPNGAKCSCGQNGCLSAYISPCIQNNVINAEKIDELLLPLAITMKNLSSVFCSSKIILTGTLMEHHRLFDEKLKKILCEIECKAMVEFLPISDYAERGAALIAINKSIESIVI